jgi:hypothetical protein
MVKVLEECQKRAVTCCISRKLMNGEKNGPRHTMMATGKTVGTCTRCSRIGVNDFGGVGLLYWLAPPQNASPHNHLEAAAKCGNHTKRFTQPQKKPKNVHHAEWVTTETARKGVLARNAEDNLPRVGLVGCCAEIGIRRRSDV